MEILIRYIGTYSFNEWGMDHVGKDFSKKAVRNSEEAI